MKIRIDRFILAESYARSSARVERRNKFSRLAVTEQMYMLVRGIAKCEMGQRARTFSEITASALDLEIMALAVN